MPAGTTVSGTTGLSSAKLTIDGSDIISQAKAIANVTTISGASDLTVNRISGSTRGMTTLGTALFTNSTSIKASGSIAAATTVSGTQALQSAKLTIDGSDVISQAKAIANVTTISGAADLTVNRISGSARGMTTLGTALFTNSTSIKTSGSVTVTADAVTTGNVIDITADGLTSGIALNIVSDSSSTTDRDLVYIKNDNSAAGLTTCLHIVNDSNLNANAEVVLIETTVADTQPHLTLQQTSTATNNGGRLRLARKDTTAEADDMYLGTIDFYGSTSANSSKPYATIRGIASDVTNSDEAGKLLFYCFAGGTDGTAASTELFSIGGEDVANTTPCAVIVNDAGIDCDLRVESADETHMLFVDGGNNQIGIGNPAPGSTLEISKVSGQPSLELSAWSATATAAHAGVLKFQKAGTATLNTFTGGDHTTAGEILGRIEAYGVDDADGATLSSYIEFANDAVSDADSSPGKIVFATSDADDAGTPTARLTIDDDGLSTFTGGVSGSIAGFEATKSTTNGTLNLGVNQTNDGNYDNTTGAMGAVRAGQVVATVNSTTMANDGGSTSTAYFAVAASGVLVTDVIVCTCTTADVRVTVSGVANGSFQVIARNETGGNIATSSTLTFNWGSIITRDQPE